MSTKDGRDVQVALECVERRQQERREIIAYLCHKYPCEPHACEKLPLHAAGSTQRLQKNAREIGYVRSAETPATPIKFIHKRTRFASVCDRRRVFRKSTYFGRSPGEQYRGSVFSSCRHSRNEVHLFLSTTPGSADEIIPPPLHRIHSSRTQYAAASDACELMSSCWAISSYCASTRTLHRRS